MGESGEEGGRCVGVGGGGLVAGGGGGGGIWAGGWGGGGCEGVYC